MAEERETTAAAAAEEQTTEPTEVSVVETEGDFFRFLLTTSRAQGVVLLKNLTPRQVDAVGEVFQNILYSEELDPNLLKTLKKQKHILRKAGDRKASVRRRKAAIKLHPLAVLKILKRVEDILPMST